MSLLRDFEIKIETGQETRLSHKGPSYDLLSHNDRNTFDNISFQAIAIDPPTPTILNGCDHTKFARQMACHRRYSRMAHRSLTWSR